MSEESPLPSRPLPPGESRRRQVRHQRRAERLRDLWRVTLYTAMAGGLGYGLLRQGWSLRQPTQVEVSGSSLVNREQVIQAAGIRFPFPLLSAQPRELSRTLSNALPVEKVTVTRLMLPPRLRVELEDREAVARAERNSAEGLEEGYVDRMGNWISTQQHQALRPRGDTRLKVVGWNERHRGSLSRLLDARKSFGEGLDEIRYEPDGSLWIHTAALGPVRLGPVDGRLPRRIEVAAHLNRTLPDRLQGAPLRMLDLSEPEQPEMILQGSALRQQGSAPSQQGSAAGQSSTSGAAAPARPIAPGAGR